MARRLTLYVTLLSWLLATGTQWDVVQVVAWARMVVVYSQNMPVTDAVELTFSREGMCNLCRLVEAGRNDEQQRAAAAGTSEKREVKALLAAPERADVLCADFAAETPRAGDAMWQSHERASPPAPPPRGSC